MNFLFVGDTHGDLDFVEEMARKAAEHNATIIQVGDWGFVWPNGNQIKKLSATLRAHRVTMRFIDGNHDWHDELNRLAGYVRHAVELEPNVIYQPRGSTYEHDGTKFLFMGGAPSIDKGNRTPGKSWWPTEYITDEDMAVALLHEKCDVLVTHDAPDFPAGFMPRDGFGGDTSFRAKSKRSMDNIWRLRDHLKPSLHMHGHWHHAHVSGVTRGLDCNYARYPGDAYYLWSKP